MSSTSPVPITRALPRPGSLNVIGQLFKATLGMHGAASPRAVWRSTRLFAQQLQWLDEFRCWYSPATPALLGVVSRRPMIVGAVARPYINTAWHSRQRLAAIRQHYTLLSGGLKCLDVGSAGPLRLAQVDAGVRRIDLVLDAPEWFVHEGELALNLFLDGERIYSLAFSVASRHADKVAFVGALQGMRSADARQLYRELTHALHGLRPRELLLAAFRLLCVRVGVDHIRAIDDHHRAASSSYFGATSDATLTSYDAIWREHGGSVSAETGFFDVPARTPRRGAESIPARKRAQYRRRYQMLDGLEVAVGRSLNPI